MGNFKLQGITINGRQIEIDDPNAVQLPDSTIQDGDMLIYNGTTQKFEFIPKSSLVEIEQNGVVKNSQKLVKSGDVFTAIENLRVDIPEVYLNVSYNRTLHKLIFEVDSNSPSELQTDVYLQCLTINTVYDSDISELKFSNICTILHLNPYVTSTEFEIPVFTEDRVMYFMLSNSNSNAQICQLNVNSLTIPQEGNTKTTVELSFRVTDHSGYQVIQVNSNQIVDVPINCQVTLTGQTSSTIEYVNLVLAANSNFVEKQISKSDEIRTARPTIAPSQTSDTQNYLLVTDRFNVPAELGRIPLTVVADQSNPVVVFSVGSQNPPATAIDIKISLPRNGTSPLVLTGTILAGESSGTISYSNQAFNGPMIGVSTGANDRDSNNRYYIPSESSSIETYVDGNGNPWS